MALTWTSDQRKVIDLTGRNILVSAAAGSGKTAVLVARIIRMISDEEHPVDIDRLLIMTFTRAAAAEMKERIERALSDLLAERPDSLHLKKQMDLLHTAQISTIHGFCAYVLSGYFHLIGLDPSSRIAEEGELTLLREEVMDGLIEEEYAKGSEDFHIFAEWAVRGAEDSSLSEPISRVYEAAMSHPRPEAWLSEQEEALLADPFGQPWMQALWSQAGEELKGSVLLLESARKICLSFDVGGYLPAIESDLAYLSELLMLCEKQDYDGMAERMAAYKYPTLGNARKAEAACRERAKKLRDEAKKAVQDLRERLFYADQASQKATLFRTRDYGRELLFLAGAFKERFEAAKREKNILDFSDLEHFALRILLTDNGEGGFVYSEAARELSERFEEVMIDEYQDSNLVQETLARAVSGWAKGRDNTFMVGDVKQSIYSFRLARPELFVEKYNSYRTDPKEGEEVTGERIDLHKNFRSRPEVLSAVNFIFRQIMGEDLGGVRYDDDAALYPGAGYGEGTPGAYDAELCLAGEEKEMGEEKEAGAIEREALMVAQRIRELVGSLTVLDPGSRKERPCGYGDIAILLRASAGWAEVFARVLSERDIPVYTSSRTGYFGAREVQTVLNVLRICDNPRQDIPLLGVLTSPIAGCSSRELALLRLADPGGMLVDCAELLAEGAPLVQGASQEEWDLLTEKMARFFARLEGWREQSSYLPIHRLILTILKDTGYDLCVRALPDGEKRGANLSMLVERARDFEKSSYRGLFSFIRYIEHLDRYEVDYGEANVSGAGEGTVKIMTIHASKGLEFPVVFVSGLGKGFNTMDLDKSELIHPRLGIGFTAIDEKRRLKLKTLKRNVIRRERYRETLGEELRILYVAMTRAREKLILTGSLKDEAKSFEKAAMGAGGEQMIPVSARLRPGSLLDFVLLALIRHPCMAAWRGETDDLSPVLKDGEVKIRFSILSGFEMVEQETERQLERLASIEALHAFDCRRVYDEKERARLEECFSFRYPYAKGAALPVKVSVSDVKKRADEEDEEVLLLPAGPKEESEPVPAFMREGQTSLAGSERGTAYHRFMECLDYERTEEDASLSDQLAELVDSEKMSREQAGCIDLADIRVFLESSLGRRMKRAALAGCLSREQPFVISRKAKELIPSYDGEETILLQGIIDAFLQEGEELVIIDYKTDRVEWGEELIKRYHHQLEDYAGAMERLTGRRVKERLIWSFCLGEMIPV